MIQDLRFAFRSFVKNPGFAVAAVLSLGLGIGANTTIFSVVDAVVLNPLAVNAPDELVAVFTNTRSGNPYGTATYADYIDYRTMGAEVIDLATHVDNEFAVRSNGETRVVPGAMVSANYFTVMGVEPVRGRMFLPNEDTTPGAHPVAVLSHSYWQQAFGADPSMIGQSIQINGHPFTVVGIAPPGFRGADLSSNPSVWVPIMMYRELVTGFFAQFDVLNYEAQRFSRRRIAFLSLVGRRQPGVTFEQAQATMKTVGQRLAETYPESNAEKFVTLAPAVEAATPFSSQADVERFIWLLILVSLYPSVVLT